MSIQVTSVPVMGSGRPTTAAPGRSSSVPPASGPTVCISAEGGLLAELHHLRSADPAAFRSKLRDMAAQLEDAAAQTAGNESEALDRLAGRMRIVVVSGDLADLRPAGGSWAPLASARPPAR